MRYVDGIVVRFYANSVHLMKIR